MMAKDIDSNGVWHVNNTQVDLLRAMIPVPQPVRTANEQEACLFLVQANEYIKQCPECESRINDDIIVLVLETVRLLPAKCCDKMMWFVEHPKQEREDYGMETD